MHTINQCVSVPLVGAVHYRSSWSSEPRRCAISLGPRRGPPPLPVPGICRWLNMGLIAVISGLGLGRLLPFSGVEPVDHRCRCRPLRLNTRATDCPGLPTCCTRGCLPTSGEEPLDHRCRRRPLRLNIRSMGRPGSPESCTSTQVCLLTIRTPHIDDRWRHSSMHTPQLQQISPASGGPTSSLGYRKTRRCSWGRDDGCGNSPYSFAAGFHQRDRYGSRPMQRPAGDSLAGSGRRVQRPAGDSLAGSCRRGRRRCSD